ncbi:TetR/AcrR family transcriptional regulator [Mycobacteroides abscessus]|uniref:TetR/AcrR family transcriptional regulator n=1 Tax=Mycobacteroides abscessus TaxID=36809 RepID=UPI0005E3805E|nr:TetR/AcrR family transcriptional regulator [Mycobacteroides abscessus]CPS45524.1 Putative transcriptional regulator%2C TetR family [Mycobacteroides abscessus]CPS47316.1 Putative transcriptional regulator%2C TetR family [Mycobacteroides abscessus]CPS56164.1 Putative transcriptional regulator%2C TetR family [Mycobacteroides abscessus]CPT39860.1 Putative transcriptional regulator%2C TetR family [Mycobacteroides abscessus]CPT63920.1 Putative transcriptional regulator%2C TetR family [Mycobactero
MDKRQGGRPRDPDKDDAVRETVRRMLAADGYQRTTIPAVARAAGIGAPTIYRRWPTQAAMVESAIADRPWPQELAAPSEFRYYLTVLVRAVVGYFADPATRAAMPGLLVEYYREPSQYAVLAERTEMPLREAFRRAHAGAVGSGERADQPGADALFDTIVGMAVYHGVLRGTADDALVEQILDVVDAASSVGRGLHLDETNSDKERKR